ncbi:MAG TPA: hypothetical protein VLZ55_01240 [Rhodanobacter sp.]|nr:hypothetical protein [Rhodanobacter sp.]
MKPTVRLPNAGRQRPPFFIAAAARYECATESAGNSAVNLATFGAAKFPFPPLDRRAAVAEKLDSLAAEVATLRLNYSRIRDDIANLRQSLLHQAFSGQLT